ncbi:MAG: XRE family transcriptional regulator [Rhizobiaceae bacterium]|nr:MAG: XRE family transcriptional regulator [Rhizobiaceae bacterium]
MHLRKAQELGRRLRERRKQLGLSQRELGRRAGVDDATVVRLEQGSFAAPRPDKLSRIAYALNLSLADVFALADYVVPSELPTFTPYLRAKYRKLPPGAVDELERYFDKLAARYGIDPAGPAPGEDEGLASLKRKGQ